LNIGADATPDAITVVPVKDDDDHIQWIGLIIIDGDVIGVVSGQHHVM
jgi:hypothetical protein